MKDNIRVKTAYEKTGADGTPMWVEVLKEGDFDKTTQNQRQLNFRAYQELERTIFNRGNVHIFSMTYMDKQLPFIYQNIFWKKHEKNEFEIEQRKINTAWKPDIQKFNYKLRNYLSDKGYRFKYIITHEYGKEDWYKDDRGKWRKGTARPHYHAIYFVVPAIEQSVFEKIIYDIWKKGRVRNDVLENNIIAGINYTTKYTTKETKLKDKRFKPTRKGYIVKDIYYTDKPNIYKTNKRTEFDKYKNEALKEDLFIPRLLISTNLGTKYITESNGYEEDEILEPHQGAFLKKEHLLPTTVNNKEVKTISTNLPRYYYNKYCKKQVKDETGKQKTISVETEFYRGFKEKLKQITTNNQYKQFIKDIHKYCKNEVKEEILKIDQSKIKFYLRNRKCNFGTKDNKIPLFNLDDELKEIEEAYCTCYIENEKARVNRMETRRINAINKRKEKAARKMQGNPWKIAK